MRNPRVIDAAKKAAVFLKPPYPTKAERQAAKLEAASRAREAIELLVRAGHDDLAFQAQELAQAIEAKA